MHDGSAHQATIGPADDDELAPLAATEAEADAMTAAVEAGQLKGVLRFWTLAALRPVSFLPRIHAFGWWHGHLHAVATSPVIRIRPEIPGGPPRLASTASGSIYQLADADRDDQRRPNAVIQSHVLRTLRHWGATIVDVARR